MPGAILAIAPLAEALRLALVGRALAVLGLAAAVTGAVALLASLGRLAAGVVGAFSALGLGAVLAVASGRSATC